MTILLALVLLFTLAACGTKDAPATTNAPAAETTAAPAETTEAAEETTTAAEETTEAVEETTEAVEETTEAVVDASAAVAEFVETNREALIATMEAAFASDASMTCAVTVASEGTALVINININELEDVSDEVKAQMQEAYDSINEVFVEALKMFQTEAPELTAMQVNVCDKNGDVLAVILAEA